VGGDWHNHLLENQNGLLAIDDQIFNAPLFVLNDHQTFSRVFAGY
jgi:hypothetical protein